MKHDSEGGTSQGYPLSYNSINSNHCEGIFGKIIVNIFKPLFLDTIQHETCQAAVVSLISQNIPFGES